MKIGVIGIDGMEVTLAANGAATATAHLWERRKSRQDFPRCSPMSRLPSLPQVTSCSVFIPTPAARAQAGRSPGSAREWARNASPA